MDVFLRWLFGNPIATTALLVAFGILVIFVISVYLVALFQGREISFWPPKIGGRPNKSGGIPESDESIGYRRIAKSKATEVAPSSASPLKIVQPPGISELVKATRQIKPHLGSINVLEVISQTDHSIIERCVIQGNLYVLKRTNRDICQEEALKDLVGQDIVGSEGTVSVVIATPVALWVTDEYVWELYPYYNGLSLHRLISRSKYRFQGEYFGLVYNSVFEAVNKLHKLGILHRDINPTNFLVMEYGNLVLLDSTFCCRRNLPQVPIENKKYSPPEQRVGQATVQSDWYSIAATLYFMANGEPPNQSDNERFSAGLEAIVAGSYYSLKYRTAGKVLKELLNADASKRPQSLYDVILTEYTIPVGFSEVLGILELGQFGYLVMQKYAFQVMARDELSDFLHQAIECNAINDPELRKEVTAFLKGLSPWSIE